MTLLHKDREASFTWLQQKLGTTPGNLDGHVQRLVAAGYVGYGKRLTDAGFQARVWIQEAGDSAFLRYVEELRLLLAEASLPQAAAAAEDADAARGTRPASPLDNSVAEKNEEGK
jgi:DNA-binding MarR family transcriptional regulator